MATDEEVARLVGQPCPGGTRCPYCQTPMVIAGSWHPEGGNSAYVVLACPSCKSTENGGAP